MRMQIDIESDDWQLSRNTTHTTKHRGLSTGKMAVWLLYNAIMTIGAVVLAPIWIVWVIATPRHRQTLFKRLGFAFGDSRPRRSDSNKSRLWVHALSVGEVNASQALVNGLLDAYPEIELTFTASTLTGFQTAERIFSGRQVDLAHYPLDWIISIQMVAKRIDPDAIILIETDVWPNFLTAMHWRGVPVYLVNMRLSDSALRTFMRVKWAARFLFGAFEKICVQTQQDLKRLGWIGVDSSRVTVTGNIKFDDEGNSGSNQSVEHWPQLLASIDHRQVIVAGSTHEGEEAELLSAMKFIKERREPPLLVLVPRNPDRSRHVVALCDEAGCSCCLLSHMLEGRGLQSPEVVVVDFIGALKQLYDLADIAFVGGSLIPEGGHNPLEPAAFAKPVLFGPDMRDFHHIAELLKQAGGARQFTEQEPLGPILLELLNDSESARRMGQNAQEVFLSNKGAVQRTLACLGLNLERPYEDWERYA
jgi:3-deoxy-D-manno-octulosonic-acid transferase